MKIIIETGHGLYITGNDIIKRKKLPEIWDDYIRHYGVYDPAGTRYVVTKIVKRWKDKHPTLPIYIIKGKRLYILQGRKHIFVRYLARG